MVKLVRVGVLTAVVASWQVSPAMAESLLQSANRLAHQAGQQLLPSAGATLGRSATTGQSAQAESGMSKRKKVIIVLIGAIGVAGGMWAIDHGVVDNTPSSKGTRKD